MTEITRLDLYQMPDGQVRVFKWAAGWGLNTPPVANYLSPVPLADMVSWLRAHGWTVRTWSTEDYPAGVPGARAWLGEPTPIRTRHEIMHRRNQMSRSWHYTRHELDLAFDT